MPLQIRRGNTAEINSITPLVGEIIYNTQTGSLHIGNGTDPGGVVATSYNDDLAKDAAAASIADGTHTNISFTYNPSTRSLSAALPATVVADLKGSVYDSTNALLVDATTNKFFGNVEASSGVSTFTGLAVATNLYDANISIISVTQAHTTADARNVSFARARGTHDVPAKVQTGDELVEMTFMGYADSQYTIGGRITCTVEDTAITNASMKSRLDFATNNGAGVSVVRVTIDSTGLLKALNGITNNTITIDNNKISTIVSNADLELDPNGTGTVDFVVAEQTTVGAAGGASALPATPTKYFKIKVNGVAYVVPAYAVA